MNARALTILSIAFALVATLTSGNASAGVEEWTINGPHGGSILNLAADPSNPATIYAATDRQVYKSVDGGQLWAPTGLLDRIDMILPTSDPAIVYATAVDSSSLRRSSDGGAGWDYRWTPQPVGWEEGLPLVAAAVDPQDPRTLYAIASISMSLRSLYRSTNGADSWELVPNPPASGVGLTGITVDPINPAVLYLSLSNGIS